MAKILRNKDRLVMLMKGMKVKTHYYSAYKDAYHDVTKSFKEYLEKRGFRNGVHFKIENVSSGKGNPKPKILKRFIWIKATLK